MILMKNKLTAGRLCDSLFFRENEMKTLKTYPIYVENFVQKIRYREGRKS